MQCKNVEDRYLPDDEVVGHGNFHMERMSDQEIFLSLGNRSFRLRLDGGARKYKIRMYCESHSGSGKEVGK